MKKYKIHTKSHTEVITVSADSVALTDIGHGEIYVFFEGNSLSSVLTDNNTVCDSVTAIVLRNEVISISACSE